MTGGAGFIGTHTCLELLLRGHDVVVADNYANSSPAALAAVRKLAGETPASLMVHEMDVRNERALDEVFAAHQVDAVIHFAARKSVRESFQIPLEYYGNNLGSTTAVAAAMVRHGVRKLVFSGSCSIYGDGYRDAIAEDCAPGPTNPYANSKLMCEQVLRDTCKRFPELSVVSLRYFNPIGAHPSGALGEDPKGIPSNVLPYMLRVVVGRLPRLQVYGDDFETRDGSGVRDYIHVMDVAEAHCLALDHVDDEPGMRVFNLGTGQGVSVLELIAAVEEAAGLAIPYEVIGRQPGDVATLIADPTLIEKTWGWKAARDLREMCADAWRFQSGHPNGYA